MKNSRIKEFREMDDKALLIEKAKKQDQIVNEKAALVQSGKKNSNQIRDSRKEIAMIETVLNERLLERVQKG